MKNIRVFLSLIIVLALAAVVDARPADGGPPHRHYGADLYYLADACYLYASPCQAGLARKNHDKSKSLCQNASETRKIYSPE